MRIKDLLLSTLSCLFLACASSVAIADDCDDLIVHVHNNTNAPLFLLYETSYTSPAITDSLIVPAGRIVTLQKMGNLGGQQDLIRAKLQLFSLHVKNQNDYALSTIEVSKEHTTGGSFDEVKGTLLADDVALPHADLGFGIDFPKAKINNGYCSTPAATKPGEITVEVYHPALKPTVK